MSDKLKDYEEKRDFRKTPEPSGGTDKGGVFVIQKHDASHLHYDFRLAVDGVLKSWAIPKGPSTDPGVKRLAIMTEDHPLDYAGFEGTIPEGEYGAGTVMVWDTGEYKNLNEESVSKGLENGHIKVWLDGRKLKGGYALTLTRPKQRHWIMVKTKDDEADARRNPVSTEPDSALTGRSLDEIREQEG